MILHLDRLDKLSYVRLMAASSIPKATHSPRSRVAGNVRLSRLMLMFERRVAELDDRGLSAVEAALSTKRPYAPDLVRALIGSDEHGIGRSDTLAGDGMGEVTSVETGRVSLDAITIDKDDTDWARSTLLGAVDAASALGIARSTLNNWRKEGRVLAFAKGVRNFLYPIEQFESRKPVEGLNGVRKHFATDESTWEWLVSSNRLTGNAPPLEWLRAGHQDEVARAAEGALDYA